MKSQNNKRRSRRSNKSSMRCGYKPNATGTPSFFVRLLPVALLLGMRTITTTTVLADRESVSFQGQRLQEHYTMEVEEGHQFRCFESKEELINAVNRYEAYNVIDMELAENYGWPIGNWCVGKITDFSDLFYDRSFFNEDIGKWDVSKATDMTAMFQNALDFNQDLSLWDTGRVTSMSRMFAAAKSFNTDISTWNTERLETTSYMFLHALAFNQDISTWNMLDHIKDMERMFRDARTFSFRESVEREWKLDETMKDDVNTHRMLNFEF